jgi:flagellin
MAGIGSIGSSQSLSALAQFQKNLLQDANQLASGNRITNAAVDPSGLAIYSSLTTQAQGFDAATNNVSDALNATNVAEGALQTSTDILQKQNALAVQASSDLLSPTDRAAIQAQADQLNQQLNTIASSINFNGLGLLNGSATGPVAATNPTASVTSNTTLLGGGTAVTGTPTVAAATPGETLQIQVINNGGTAQAQVNVVDSTTGAVTNAGTFGAGASVTVAGTTFQLGNFTTADTGAAATIQVNPGTTGSTGSGVTVQTGASQGSTTTLSFPQTDVGTLGSSNLSFATTANAENAQGQVLNSLSSLLTSRADLGAQAVSLGYQAQNNQVASVNLTASADSIGGTDIGSTVSDFQKNSISSQISLALLANANTNAGHLSAILDQAL